jgi:membrane protease YdiL (CAAX protease family)
MQQPRFDGGKEARGVGVLRSWRQPMPRIPFDGGELRRLSAFVLISYAIAWGIWIPLVIAGPTGPRQLALVGTFAPAVAALLLARSGRRSWLGGVLRTPGLHLRSYLEALVLPVVLALVAAGIAGVVLGVAVPVGGVIPAGLPAPIAIVAPVPVFASLLVIGGPLGEEPGWRGYLLPSLQTRLGPPTASLVVGIVWAAWHAPLFLLPGTTQSHLPVLAFVLWVVSLSFVFTWLYNRRSRSVGLAVLLHASVNFTGAMLGVIPARGGDSAVPFLILSLVTAFAAVLVAMSWRRKASDVSAQFAWSVNG